MLSKKIKSNERITLIGNDAIIKTEKGNINKATQNTDISTKIIKENSDIFGDFIFSNLNCCINTSLNPSLLKKANITNIVKHLQVV